jgi:hypothetical protein
MSKVKRQHWVSRFYLKQFAIDKNKKVPQVWNFSKFKGNPFIVNINDIAVKNYLYSPQDTDGSRDYYMEHKLASLEHTVGMIWNDFANDFIDLDNQSNRKIISLFIATLYLRHPKRLAEYEDFQNKMIEFYKTIPKDKNGRPDISYLVVKGKEVEFDTTDWEKYSNPTKYDKELLFVSYIEDLAIEFAEIFMKKRWSVVFSESKQFITSDNPLVITNSITNKIDNSGFKEKGTALKLPISPTRVLVLDDLYDEPSSQYYPTSENTAVEINTLSWINTHRFMISHRDTDEVIKEIIDYQDNK